MLANTALKLLYAFKVVEIYKLSVVNIVLRESVHEYYQIGFSMISTSMDVTYN